MSRQTQQRERETLTSNSSRLERNVLAPASALAFASVGRICRRPSAIDPYLMLADATAAAAMAARELRTDELRLGNCSRPRPVSWLVQLISDDGPPRFSPPALVWLSRNQVKATRVFACVELRSAQASEGAAR